MSVNKQMTDINHSPENYKKPRLNYKRGLSVNLTEKLLKTI